MIISHTTSIWRINSPAILTISASFSNFASNYLPENYSPACSMTYFQSLVATKKNVIAIYK